MLRGGPQALVGLPRDTRAAILPDLTRGFTVTFAIGAAIAVAGFIAIGFLEEVPLRTTTGKVPVQAE